jgi:G6PDH family F420-dependent oxidoreductase
MKLGYFLSSEEHSAKTLVDHAIAAEEAGFDSIFISDHYHPWIDAQGESPFVWSVIGAIAARTNLEITTGVTCPTVRIHPAVIAQAAATSQLLCDGRFRLGVGTGENLNEHILGDHWPSAAVRLEMLEEAVEILRGLWEGGVYNHRGPHFTVENARIYSLPGAPPPIIVSGFGPKAVEAAARFGDGFVTTQPNPEYVELYRKSGRGPALGVTKVCWAADEALARKTAFELWPTEALTGQLSQELPMPKHFEEAASVVTEEMVAETVPCGADPEHHLAALQKYVDAGFDELFVNQIGDDAQGFFDFFNAEIRPKLAGCGLTTSDQECP